MIIDDIQNIRKYKNIPDKVSQFLFSLNENSQIGHYKISDKAFANIDEYVTKDIENCKFEAHKKYIDIQMLLSGCEELDYINIADLKVKEEYDENRDVMFFDDPNKEVGNLILEPFKFAFIFPHEAHKPQIAFWGKKSKVKKVVVKIEVE